MIQRPLTGKFKACKLMLDKLPAEHFAKDTTEIIDEMLNAKYTMDDLIGPNVRVRDLLEVPGFYLNEEIISHVVASLVGRYIRAISMQHGIDPRDPKMLPILVSTTQRELVATQIVVKKMRAKYGKPDNYDQAAVDALVRRFEQGAQDGLAQLK